MRLFVAIFALLLALPAASFAQKQDNGGSNSNSHLQNLSGHHTGKGGGQGTGTGGNPGAGGSNKEQGANKGNSQQGSKQ